ncbi:MAG: SAM hydrolase/SAM-dependent halogenase family protein [Acidiferrobacter sp.]
MLLTDFGVGDPYVGQMHLRLNVLAPGVPVLDLFHGLPNFAVDAAAYLIPAYCQHVPSGAIVVAVVDPGVGGSRRAISLSSGGRYYIGPDNGIFEMVARRYGTSTCVSLPIPDDAAPTFHGRDVFVPAAASLACGDPSVGPPVSLTRFGDWLDDGMKIVYIDHYGNAITGMRARPQHQALRVRGHTLARARTFADRPRGEPFFYENANGLIEIAANGASVAAILGLQLADPFVVLD